MNFQLVLMIQKHHMTQILGGDIMRATRNLNILNRRVLMSVMAPFLLVACTQSDTANQAQIAAHDVEVEATPTPKVLDVPLSEQSVSELLQTIVKHTQEIDAVPLRFDGRTEKTIRRGESIFTDRLFAEEIRRKRLDGTTREYLLKWLSVDTNFNHEIAKRCRPGRQLGFVMFFDLEKPDRIRAAIDLQCNAITFFDTNGNGISGTYYDLSEDMIEPLLKKMFQK